MTSITGGFVIWRGSAIEHDSQLQVLVVGCGDWVATISSQRGTEMRLAGRVAAVLRDAFHQLVLCVHYQRSHQLRVTTSAETNAQ